MRIFLLLSFLICGLYTNAQDKLPGRESFEEDTVTDYYQAFGNSFLEVDHEKSYFGKRSLKWEWNGEGGFQTSHFRILNKKESPLAYGDHFPSSPTFVVSIYNKKENRESIKISFESEEGKVIFFKLPLNFYGWRTIWVPFYEMQGDSPIKGEKVHFDKMKVETLSQDKMEGLLYFDDIVFSQYQDDRHSYPDKLVPFIKEDLDAVSANHWMPLLENMAYLEGLTVRKISKEEIEDLVTIENKIRDGFALEKEIHNPLVRSNKFFNQLGVTEVKGEVDGPPLTYRNEQVYFEPRSSIKKQSLDIKEFGNVMRRLSRFYLSGNKRERKKIGELFVLGAKYFLDQGWQAGSSGGTRHHVGYGLRELSEAFFIMKKPLEDSGLLNEVGSSLRWLYNFGRILGSEDQFRANIDFYNTQSFYYLMFVFLTDDINEQGELLKKFSRYMSVTLAEDGETGVFKKDGTVWHHNGHYPAYGVGAFRVVPTIINFLSGTHYQISEEGYKNFKKSLMATRWYSQLTDWGFGNAGRHPFEGRNNIRNLQNPFLLMAFSGDPGKSTELDIDFAQAYLRIWGADDNVNSKLFQDLYGLTPERLKGFKSFPYGGTAVARNRNWAAIIKGYSQYIWSSEIYVDENRYGRYLSNGSIQLLNDKGEGASGFGKAGWDWNRFPGTTSINLTWEDLEPDTPLLMFKSNETFLGSNSLDDFGVFAMKLNEAKGENADGPQNKTGFSGKLAAHKSVFFLGDFLIALGTNISSVDSINPVETTLFQNKLRENKQALFLYKDGDKDSITGLDDKKIIQGKDLWIQDAQNNIYKSLKNNRIIVSKRNQKSFTDRYSVKTGKLNPKANGIKETKGLYTVGYIDHGTNPQNESYAYLIYPFVDSDLADFAKQNDDDKFEILAMDKNLHAVKNFENNITGYVVFDPNVEFPENGILQEVSVPGIILIKKISQSSYMLEVLNPDLHMGSNVGFSNPTEITIKLKGHFDIVPKNKAHINSRETPAHTVIKVINQHGDSETFILNQK